MIQGYSYWFWMGTFYLIILTYKDFKNNMNIDDRQNWFMMGATFVLFSHINRHIGYILILLLTTIAINYYIRKFKLIGEADNSTITWLFYGFGIIDPILLLYFLMVFGSISIFYMLLKKVALKILKLDNNTPTPFYHVILVSYITMNIIYHLY